MSTRNWSWAAGILMAAIPLMGMIYAFNLPSYLGYPMWNEQAALLVLGAGLGATFLRTRYEEVDAVPVGTPTMGDKLLAVIAIASSMWTAINYEELIATGYLGFGSMYYVNLAIAIVSLALILEAVRRLTGVVMVVLVSVCLGYALVAQHLPGSFEGHANNIDFLLGYLYLDSSGVVGTPLGVVVSTVIAYVLLGTALFRLGGGQMFLDLALASMGGFRGGSAKATILASSMFGSVSGSAVANVATTGIVTIPLMKKTGYRPVDAGAIEAVSSTGGQLIPPIMGAAAFIMAEFLGVPYAEVALAAVVPALIFYVALLAQVHLHAIRTGVRVLTKVERPEASVVLRKYWPFLIPIVLLLVLLLVFRLRPEKAAFASLLCVLAAAALVRERPMGPRALVDILVSTGQSLLAVIAITAAAGIVVGVLSVTGLGFSLGLGLVEAAGANLFLLLLITSITCITFGMGMPTTAVYVVMATLAVPPLIAHGIDRLAAHLFVLYYGVLSMITPPVCLASFTAAGLAKAPFMATGFASIRFGAVCFIVPFLFVAEPAILLQDRDWVGMAKGASTAIIGCILLAAAVEGYLIRVLKIGERVLLAAAAGFLTVPDGGDYEVLPAVRTDVVGALLLVGSISWLVWSARRER